MNEKYYCLELALKSTRQHVTEPTGKRGNTSELTDKGGNTSELTDKRGRLVNANCRYQSVQPGTSSSRRYQRMHFGWTAQ